MRSAWPATAGSSRRSLPEDEAARAGKPARLKEFRYTTLDSWSSRRRIVGKAEWTGGEANPCFVVTSLIMAEARSLLL